MGQAIVYCSNCSAQLRTADFEARKAFKVDDLQFCAKCYHEIVGSDPPPPQPSLTGSTKTKIPVPPQKHGHGTSQIAIIPPPPPRAPESSAGVYVGLGLAGAVILVAAMAMSGGSERPSPPPAPAPAPAPIVIPTPAPPSVSPRESAAQQALAKALRTENLEERRTLLVEAVAQAAGTTLYPDAQREMDKVERKLAEARAAAAANKPPQLAPVVQPPPPPAPTPAPTPPPAPDRSAEEAAALAKWEAALAPAIGRDYASAIAALEKLGNAAPDVALLKSVSTLHQEAVTALTRTAKGQKVALDYRDAAGKPRRVEASFVEVENGCLELRSDAAALTIEIGEILPSSLADLLKSRGSAVDPATAAAFGLLEGDEAGAKRLAAGATVPDRYWAYARKASAADPARALYAEAQATAASYATAADAVPKYQALLRDHAETPFVRRNKASITARSQQCARDFLFASADLKAAGTFKPMKIAKGFVGFTSEADSDPAKLKDNFVELSFSVLPDTAYKCWVYAGGCCQETFEFGAQGTEMKSAKEKEPVEPGSGAAATIKPFLLSLKKTHAGHTGPKQPTHWEWVPIPLPKYSKGGLQQVRLLTTQKGFSVAFACVTSSRTTPPRESELKELERTRGSVAVTPAASKGVVLYQPALDGTDLFLLGEVRDKALHGVLAFGACFAGYEAGSPAFKVPAQGELRFTYYLKTLTPFKVRFRVPRAGKEHSDGYDVLFPDAVAGRPTEMRVPVSSFKPMFGANLPPLAAGDPVTMIYFIADDPNCGLRIDGFSVVELKNEPTGAASRVLFAENFDAGPGKFVEGEWDKTAKAYVMPCKGISAWSGFAVPAKDSVTISFRIKPIDEVPGIQILVWSEKLQDNGRIIFDGLKKGEWKEIKFKATQLRIGAAGDGAPIDTVNSIKIFQRNSAPDAKALFDDFEIRE